MCLTVINVFYQNFYNSYLTLREPGWNNQYPYLNNIQLHVSKWSRQFMQCFWRNYNAFSNSWRSLWIWIVEEKKKFRWLGNCAFKNHIKISFTSKGCNMSSFSLHIPHYSSRINCLFGLPKPVYRSYYNSSSPTLTSLIWGNNSADTVCSF